MRAALEGLLKRCLGGGTAAGKPVHRHRPKIAPAGKHFDLREIFERVNRDCFAGKVTAAITWGRRAAGGNRRSIRLGSYRREQNLIRIHPALDAPFVPAYVVEAVVHHEMLHAVIPVRVGRNGRRIVHGGDFRAGELGFSSYRRAKMWRREHIARLLQG
jgi:hypothetical protein